MVTTAGMICSTIGAYEATGTAGDPAGAELAIGAGVDAARAFTSGAFQAASVTHASATAARPPFFKVVLCMLLITSIW
jgi:hypothetical protein